MTSHYERTLPGCDAVFESQTRALRLRGEIVERESRLLNTTGYGRVAHLL